MNPRRLMASACLPLLATTVVLVAPTATAAPRADYQAPFPCGQTWTGSTRSGHSPSSNSVDFNRPDDEWDPVVAAADGTVKVADAVDNSGYGRWVWLDHGNGESTIYAHLNSVSVRSGAVVEQGQQVGLLGSTGNSTGPHLHFEQRSGSTVSRPWFNGQPYGYGSITSRNCGQQPSEPEEPEEPTTPIPTPTTNVPLAGNMVLDGRDDLTVFRRLKLGNFVVQRAGKNPLVRRMGLGSDTPLMGRWDGAERARPGYYRPSTSTFVLRSPSGNVSVPFGRPGDVPVVGDWDGNGTTEVGVRRGTTFLKRMADGEVWTVNLGTTTDVPVVGDWNGDRIADLGVYTPSTSTFTLRTLGSDWVPRTSRVRFGTANSVPVVGDWDGNGVTDLGTWVAGTSTFSLRQATAPSAARFTTATVQFSQGQG